MRHCFSFPWAGTKPRCSRSALTQRGWQAFKMRARFLIRKDYKSGVQNQEHPGERESTSYSLFMCTGIQLGSTWTPTNIVAIGWLRRERLSRAVLCYKNWLRAAAPVPSLGLHAPRETTACLHPVPLNMANKALWRVLCLDSGWVDVILMPILCLWSRTGLQTGIWPH